MNNSLEFIDTEECPECGDTLSTVYDRSFLELLDLKSGKMKKVFIRYPLLKCTICHTKYGFSETREAIGNVVAEDYQNSLKAMHKEAHLFFKNHIEEHFDELEKSRRKCMLMAYLNGIVDCILIMMAIYAFRRHNWTAATIDISAFTFRQICLLLPFWFRRQKKKREVESGPEVKAEPGEKK